MYFESVIRCAVVVGDFFGVPNPLILLLLALTAILFIVIGMRRRKRDLRQYLEPPLRDCGVQYISAVAAPLMHTGPFPKIEFEVGRPYSNVGGVSGEYREYKIVTFCDSEKKVYRIWALVDFEAFSFRRVRWRAEDKSILPSCVLPLLEN